MLSDIRDMIVSELGGIQGLNVYTEIPDTMTPPAVLVTLALENGIEYDYTAQNFSALLRFWLEVLVARTSSISEAQKQLDPYLWLSGDQSIKQAVELADWGSIGASVRLARVLKYGEATYNKGNYIGATLLLEVVASDAS